MSITRFLVHCLACDATFRPARQAGEPCPSCKQPLESGMRRRTPYAGEALIGAYGNGPPEKPWPEIKEGPLKGQNVVEGGLKALKDWGKRNGTVWQ